jgi:hypothetical protein
LNIFKYIQILCPLIHLSFIHIIIHNHTFGFIYAGNNPTGGYAYIDRANLLELCAWYQIQVLAHVKQALFHGHPQFLMLIAYICL